MRPYVLMIVCVSLMCAKTAAYPRRNMWSVKQYIVTAMFITRFGVCPVPYLDTKMCPVVTADFINKALLTTWVNW